MELYQLRIFLTVAEEQHLTRAAERLHVSQPSVSAHIKALEEELGLTLFVRTPKGMTLTSEGLAIKAKAESALRAADAVKFKADEIKKDFAGEARIGLNIDAKYLKIPDLLSIIRQELPKLELHFFQRHSLEAPDQVRNGLLDAAFVFELPPQTDLQAVQLATFGIVIVAPLKWKKRLPKAELRELADLPWIWPDHRCPFHRIITELMKPLNQKPEKAVVVDQDTTIRRMVASGAGLGLLVEAEAREAESQNELVVLGDTVANLELTLLHLKKRTNDPVVRAIINGVSKVWATPNAPDK